MQFTTLFLIVASAIALPHGEYKPMHHEGKQHEEYKPMHREYQPAHHEEYKEEVY